MVLWLRKSQSWRHFTRTTYDFSFGVICVIINSTQVKLTLICLRWCTIAVFMYWIRSVQYGLTQFIISARMDSYWVRNSTRTEREFVFVTQFPLEMYMTFAHLLNKIYSQYRRSETSDQSSRKSNRKSNRASVLSNK